ncbi:MAG: hypothetical protein EXQ55_06025 [Acidobacteria bacterium]|nr:hypothetical protein [Acidobacteriota bacterium]
MITTLLVFLFLAGWPSPIIGNRQQPPPPDGGPALTILPFANLTGDPADAWIGAGIAETLAVAFGASVEASAPGARPASARFISGAYQRVGNVIRITARLVETGSGRVIRAVKVDGPRDELFALEDRLVAELSTGAPGQMGEPQPRLSEGSASRPAGAAEASRNRAQDTVRAPGASPNAAASAPSATVPATTGVRVVPAPVIDGPPPPVPPAVVTRDAEGHVTLRAVRLAEPLILDGRLDDPVYDTVPAVSDFVQQEPDEGAPATEKTEAWIFFDDRNVYVSARCWDSQPQRMIANEMRRDGNVMQNENFAVMLDTYYDRRNGFLFHVNPLGGMFDADVRPTLNRDWNGVWDVKTGRFDGGWMVEMVIPFKSLRYRKGESPLWGVNLRRIVKWKNEMSYLVPMPASFSMGAITQASRAGTLVGLEVPGAASNIELKPYAISDLTTNRISTPTIDNELGGDAGFDFKYGITESLTADLTYNTDFAQVEVDEQQVNLTRFNLFFPEKREFFLEGQGIFDFGGNRSGGGGGGLAPVLFFSRRIGLTRGQAVPIDVGGRLTGKVGRFMVGVLHIQTGDDPKSSIPSTGFDVVRVKRDILRRSSIGALVTRRSVSEDGPGSSLAYGLDGTFSFYDNLNINTYLARTDTPGGSGDDMSYRAQFDYAADGYGVQLEQLVVEERFNPEVGFLRRPDVRRSFGSARFSPRPGGGVIRKLSWTGSFDYIADGAGTLETRTIDGGFGIDFENSDNFRLGFTRNYEFLSEPFKLRTGVTIPIGGYAFDEWQTSYNFGLQRKLSGGVSVSRGGFYSGEKTSVSISRGRIEITPQVSVEPGVTFDWVDLPEGSFTSRLATARATYTMTPRMYVGALLQYNASSASLNSNVRLRWEYVPGSDFFVVYTEERDSLAPRFPAIKNRALVVKINRLFRF